MGKCVCVFLPIYFGGSLSVQGETCTTLCSALRGLQVLVLDSTFYPYQYILRVHKVPVASSKRPFSTSNAAAVHVLCLIEIDALVGFDSFSEASCARLPPVDPTSHHKVQLSHKLFIRCVDCSFVFQRCLLQSLETHVNRKSYFRTSSRLHLATMADNGAGKTPATAVTGTLEEKINDKDEIRPAGAHSPLPDASRGLLPDAAEGGEEGGQVRARGHSNSDSDSSAVDSDEEEVRINFFQFFRSFGRWVVELSLM